MNYSPLAIFVAMLISCGLLPMSCADRFDPPPPVIYRTQTEGP